MEIDVFTLFPDAFEWFGRQHHMVGALAHGHALGYVNYREHTPLRAGQVDDTPFGGGPGMVLASKLGAREEWHRPEHRSPWDDGKAARGRRTPGAGSAPGVHDAGGVRRAGGRKRLRDDANAGWV